MPIIPKPGTVSTAQLDTAQGNTQAVAQVAHGFSALDCVVNIDATWTLITADALANMAEGDAPQVVESVGDVDNFVARRRGKMAAAAHGLGDGPIYVGTDGALTATKPSSSNNVVLCMGHGYDDDNNSLYIEPGFAVGSVVA